VVALPAADMGQGMLDLHALAPLCVNLR
jgi:hypothetical protein